MMLRNTVVEVCGVTGECRFLGNTFQRQPLHLVLAGLAEDVRKVFFENYTVVAAAWKQKEKPDTVPRC